jgi:hypothetical protein
MADGADDTPHTTAANAADKVEIGSSCWVPASATQLMFTIPPELNVNASGGRLAYLPCTFKGLDPADPLTGLFPLEWSTSVVIKCRVDEALPRIPEPPQGDVVQLSKLPVLNAATVTDHIWMRYRYCLIHWYYLLWFRIQHHVVQARPYVFNLWLIPTAGQPSHEYEHTKCS